MSRFEALGEVGIKVMTKYNTKKIAYTQVPILIINCLIHSNVRILKLSNTEIHSVLFQQSTGYLKLISSSIGF